jgi:hypothetical protein
MTDPAVAEVFGSTDDVEVQVPSEVVAVVLRTDPVVAVAAT